MNEMIEIVLSKYLHSKTLQHSSDQFKKTCSAHCNSMSDESSFLIKLEQSLWGFHLNYLYLFIHWFLVWWNSFHTLIQNDLMNDALSFRWNDLIFNMTTLLLFREGKLMWPLTWCFILIQLLIGNQGPEVYSAVSCHSRQKHQLNT